MLIWSSAASRKSRPPPFVMVTLILQARVGGFLLTDRNKTSDSVRFYRLSFLRVRNQ